MERLGKRGGMTTTESLADRIARLHVAPEGMTNIRISSTNWYAGQTEGIDITAIIRELQARLDVAERALRKSMLVFGGEALQKSALENAMRLGLEALSATDLTKPYPLPKPEEL